jgi:hypothetical protein
MSRLSQVPVRRRRDAWRAWALHLGLLLAGGSLLALAPGCHSLGLLYRDRAADGAGRDRAVPGVPTPSKCFRLSPYLFCADFEVDRNLPLFADLVGLRDQVYKELHLPPGSAVVQVYLFETEEHYRRFMGARYPRLPARRAFFVAEPRPLGGGDELLVYTFWGDRVQQDLRHELTHALLHSVIRDVPLWLDEGLAEYFELPPGQNGVSATHLRHLCDADSGGFVPGLERLEGLSEVDKMERPEYREAWAWVHLMLRSTPEAKKVLLGYLAYLQRLRLRDGEKPEPLGPRLATVFAAPEEALKQHLARLDAAGRKELAEQR